MINVFTRLVKTQIIRILFNLLFFLSVFAVEVLLALRRFVWVQSHGTVKEENNEQEARRSEEGKILAGENGSFPPLTSASPRLLFDFLPALMSPRDQEKTHTKRRRAVFFQLRFLG